MVSETHIYYLNIYFSCKHSNIIATFLSQGELNKNLICHVNFEHKCRYPKPVGSINPYLPYYFRKMTLKALGIFRIQQNGLSNAFFFPRDFRNRQANSAALSCAHAGCAQSLPANVLCARQALLPVCAVHTHTQLELGGFTTFWVPAWSQIFQIGPADKNPSCFSLPLGCSDSESQLAGQIHDCEDKISFL